MIGHIHVLHDYRLMKIWYSTKKKIKWYVSHIILEFWWNILVPYRKKTPKHKYSVMYMYKHIRKFWKIIEFSIKKKNQRHKYPLTLDLMVGGSCSGSPTRINLFAWYCKGIIQSSSFAWEACSQNGSNHC